MALSLIVGVDETMTKESVLSFLTGSYPSLSGRSVVLTTTSDPVCQQLAYSISDQLNVQVQISSFWDQQQDNESPLVYEVRLNSVYCEFVHSNSLQLAIVKQRVLSELWAQIFHSENRRDDPMFAVEVLEDGEVFGSDPRLAGRCIGEVEIIDCEARDFSELWD